VRLTILGCGGSGGVPQIGGPDGAGDWGACDPAEPRNRRTRSALLLDGPEGRLLVDAGPDLRAQCLAQRIDRVDGILFTHAHADHIGGVDELRPLNRALGAAIPAYGTEATLAELRARFAYVFRPPTPPVFYRPALDPRPVVPGDRLRLAGLEIRLFRQDHRVMDTLGLRIGDVAYSTDVVDFPPESWPFLEHLDTWILGCFQRAPHGVHAGLDRALEWVARWRPRRTILTHMSPDLDWAWLRANLPPGVEPAFDGMRLDLTPVDHPPPAIVQVP
jgi:phosphoribosyl 1,2-cyclic phosphate phosphodiesterase